MVKLCSETRTPIVPQGGNTGLVGGQIPPEAATRRSCFRCSACGRCVKSTSPPTHMTVEAGMILADAQAEADAPGRLFPSRWPPKDPAPSAAISPPTPAARASRYGCARDLVLGIEAVLADGRIYAGLSKLKKDNTGYDLKQLFIGSEGRSGSSPRRC